MGILTGGGDCPGLNAVIRAAVRTAIRDHDTDVLGIQLGFEGLLTDSAVPLTIESIRGILPKGGDAAPHDQPRQSVLKYVDPDGEIVKTAQSIGISFGDGR